MQVDFALGFMIYWELQPLSLHSNDSCIARPIRPCGQAQLVNSFFSSPIIVYY